MKIRPHHRRDFSAYLRWYRQSRHANFLPWEPTVTPGTADALGAFVTVESGGGVPTTKHRRLLYAVLAGKALLNYQIKEWAEGWQEVPPAELREGYEWLPDWVWKALQQSTQRHIIQWLRDRSAPKQAKD